MRSDDHRHVITPIRIRHPQTEDDRGHDCCGPGEASAVEVLTDVKHELVHALRIIAVDVHRLLNPTSVTARDREYFLGPAVIGETETFEPHAPGVRAVDRVQDMWTATASLPWRARLRHADNCLRVNP